MGATSPDFERLQSDNRNPTIRAQEPKTTWVSWAGEVLSGVATSVLQKRKQSK